jgi:hypothetical protein
MIVDGFIVKNEGTTFGSGGGKGEVVTTAVAVVSVSHRPVVVGFKSVLPHFGQRSIAISILLFAVGRATPTAN